VSKTFSPNLALAHCTIVRKIGVGEKGGGLSFISNNPIPLAEVLAIARQIAKALEAANERGIIH
jgi:serine/threonine protein kinase